MQGGLKLTEKIRQSEYFGKKTKKQIATFFYFKINMFVSIPAIIMVHIPYYEIIHLGCHEVNRLDYYND